MIVVSGVSIMGEIFFIRYVDTESCPELCLVLSLFMIFDTIS